MVKSCVEIKLSYIKNIILKSIIYIKLKNLLDKIILNEKIVIIWIIK